MSGVLSNQAVHHLADKATDERDIGYGEVLRLTASHEALRAERDALAARLAEAEKDAPRLNHVNAVLKRLTSPGLYQEWLGPHPDTPDGVRAAIDDAIKLAKESENDHQ